MAGPLPPLNALKAFEATARHLSVKLAAEELCVTPGAVSQMVKLLETHLGVLLFRRVTRGLLLTDAGRDYLPAVRQAFRLLTEASRRVSGAASAGLLTVSVTPFFASAWLVSRLQSFHESHPDIDLQLTTAPGLVDFTRSGVDLAVRHGSGRYPGLRSDLVLAVEMIAVAAPAAVARHGLPATPSDLARWPRIHDSHRQGWSLWFEANAVIDAPPPRGPAFDDPGLLLKAVLAGQGAALLPAAMVAAELADGRLTQLLEARWPEAFAYYLVYPLDRQDQPKIAAFRQWILAQASEPV